MLYCRTTEQIKKIIPNANCYVNCVYINKVYSPKNGYMLKKLYVILIVCSNNENHVIQIKKMLYLMVA